MQKKIIDKYTIILALIILFHVGTNVFFLSNDDLPLLWDIGLRHENSVNNFNQLMQGNFSSIINQYVFFIDAPLVSYPSFFLYFLFGTSEDVSSFQGTIFLIILIIATYLLGKELFNKNVGLLSAILVSFSPYLLALSKVPYEDIAFAAMFTLTLYFFLKSKKFSGIKYTWFFNIFLGLTLLTKFNSIFVIIFVALTYIVLKLFFDRKDFRNFFSKFKKRNIIHFLISFFVSMIIPFFFYLTFALSRLFQIYEDINMQNHNFFGTYNLLVLTNYLIKTTIMNFEYLFIFAIFIVSLIFFLIFSKRNKLLIVSLILASTIYHIIILYFFTFDINYTPRYMVFMKPIYLIIISLFLIDNLYNLVSKIFKKFKLGFFNRKKYFISLIVLSMIVFIPFTFLFNYTNLVNEPIELSFVVGKYHPSKIGYDVKKVLDDIVLEDENSSIFCPQPCSITIFNTYATYNHKNNLELIYTIYIGDDLKFTDNFNMLSGKYDYLIKNNTFQVEKLLDFDYIILADTITSDIKENVYLYEKISSYVLKNPDNFEVFTNITADDFKTKMIIYKINKK